MCVCGVCGVCVCVCVGYSRTEAEDLINLALPAALHLPPHRACMTPDGPADLWSSADGNDNLAYVCPLSGHRSVCVRVCVCVSVCVCYTPSITSLLSISVSHTDPPSHTHTHTHTRKCAQTHMHTFIHPYILYTRTHH